MKPINRAERKKAFGNFLLFFIITVAVIVVTIFFSIQVPARQNQYLLKQMAQVEQEKVFAESFRHKMQETMLMLDSVNQSNNPDRMELQIQNNIAQLNQMAIQDSSSSSFYLAITQSLDNLRRTKSDLRYQMAKYANVGNIQDVKDQRISLLESSLAACQNALQIARSK